MIRNTNIPLAPWGEDARRAGEGPIFFIMYKYKTASKKILGDLNTPVSAYMKIRDDYPMSALMECSDYHGGENSRSFIGVHPIGSVSIEHGMGVCKYPDGTQTQHEITKEYGSAQLINEFLSSFQVEGENSENCGLFGYTSFNAVRYFENINVKDETQPQNDAPDLLYILYKDVVVFDHFRNEMIIIELLSEGEPDDLDVLEKDINNRQIRPYDFHPVGDYTSTLTDEEHKANIRQGIKHCLRGDVFQIVLSRRFKQKYEGDDFKLYRALRSINPSPYLFYFDFGGFRIFGSSPETHCRIEKKGDSYHAYIDPIAGTTKRTGNTEQDRQNAEYLRTDPKENAEHVMLVDLARNDLNDLLVIHPHHFEARLSLAVVLQRMGKRQEALDQLNQTIQMHADSAVAYAARANLERDMKQDDAALYDWQRAEELSPRDATYVVSHVDLLLVLERREEARRVLDAAVRRGIPRGMLNEWYAKCKR